MKKRLVASQVIRRYLIIPPVLLGIIAVVLIVKLRPGLEPVPRQEATQPVRVIRTESMDVKPRALGYGTSAPGRVWRGVAQVAGKVIEKSERLNAGVMVEEGTVLVRIDPREYELAVKEIEASITNLQAQLAESDTRESNAKASLAIESRGSELLRQDLERKKELVEDGTISQTEVDAAERGHLQQIARVRELDNTLLLIPVQRQSLEANRNAYQARRETAQLNLSHTIIRAPFDCRIVRDDVEETQFVALGQVLAEAHGIDVAEVSAQFSIAKVRPLLPAGTPAPDLTEIVSGDLIDRFGLDAVIRLRAGTFSTSWEGRVDRIDGVLDPETRTLGVIVAVDRPYEQVIPGVRPPLVKGVFCEVELGGPVKTGRILVPRTAVHGEDVYLVVEGRLQRRRISIDFSVQDFFCIGDGLSGGETLVVSDLIPAIDGMLLDPVPDERLQERLVAAARGEANVR